MAAKNDKAKTEKVKKETMPVTKTESKTGELVRASDPFRLFDDLRAEMEELWRPRNWPFWPTHARFRTPTANETATWLPSTDVYRSNGDLVVKADLPGLTKSDVEVTVKDGYLEVKGERKEEKKEENKEYFRSERTYGSFYRRVPLPEGVDAGRISAKVHDGVLEVTVPLPATEATKPAAKKIAVK
jgi:HSP20 family protein